MIKALPSGGSKGDFFKIKAPTKQGGRKKKCANEQGGAQCAELALTLTVTALVSVDQVVRLLI